MIILCDDTSDKLIPYRFVDKTSKETYLIEYQMAGWLLILRVTARLEESPGSTQNRVADNVRRSQLTKAGFRESATEIIPPLGKLEGKGEMGR